MLPLLARLAPPLAAGLAMASYAAQEVSAGAAAETAALAFFATVVLLPAAALARPGAAETLLGSVLAAAAVWVLPHGPLREGTVAALLVAVVAVAAARRLAAERRAGGTALPLAVALPLALAAQALLRSVVLLPPQLGDLGWRAAVILVALPAAAAVALAVLGRRLGAGPALLLGGVAALLGPGWNVKTTFGLLAAAAVSLLARRWLPPQSTFQVGRSRAPAYVSGALAALLIGAALLATPPWLRAQPAAALLRATPARGSFAPLPSDVTLNAAAPVWEASFSPEVFATRTVVLDSALANSAPLERGRPVAAVALRDASGAVHRFLLRAGIETGEWAAARPEVAARLRAGAPEPWLSWIVGDYLARRYRARWTLPAPAAATHVRVQRDAALPSEVLLSLHYLELRR